MRFILELDEIQWWYIIFMSCLLLLWVFLLYPWKRKQFIEENNRPLNFFSFMFWRCGKGPDYLNFFAWGIFTYRVIQAIATLIVKGVIF